MSLQDKCLTALEKEGKDTRDVFGNQDVPRNLVSRHPLLEIRGRTLFYNQDIDEWMPDYFELSVEYTGVYTLTARYDTSEGEDESKPKVYSRLEGNLVERQTLLLRQYSRLWRARGDEISWQLDDCSKVPLVWDLIEAIPADADEVKATIWSYDELNVAFGKASKWTHKSFPLIIYDALQLITKVVMR